MKHVKIEHDHLWLLAGTVEELRSAGVAIPAEVDDRLDESLRMVNFPPFMRDRFPAHRARIIELLEAAPAPDDLPDRYRTMPPTSFTDRPRLAPFETNGFFRDRVLGVGLKSYPLVADVDADGRKDLLVGDHDGFIYVFRNTGTDAAPAFARGERLCAVDTGAPVCVQPNPKMSLGDLTGSGAPDLVLGNYGGQVAMLPNRSDDGTLAYAMGDVTFLRTRKGVIDVGNYAYPELADLSGDGRLDLVVGNIDGDLIYFRNAGAKSARGAVLFEEGVPLAGIERLMYPHPVFADWNGDGRLDLVLGHREGTIVVYLDAASSGPPRFVRHDFARHADGRPVAVSLLSHPCVVDWHDRGRPDLLVGNDPGQVVLFANVGTAAAPVFAEGVVLKDEGGELIMGVHPVFTMADLNGDGRRDLVAGTSEDRLRVFMNVGSAAAPDFDDHAWLEDVSIDAEALAAHPDVPIACRDRPGLAFNTEYLGNLAPFAADWHGMGVVDLLVGHHTGFVFYFANAGTRAEARFARGAVVRFGGLPLRVAGFSTPCAVDWDNDGHLDLVVGDLLGRVHVFLSAGPARVPAFDRHLLVHAGGEPVTLGPRSIVEVADLDGDGRKDVLVGNRFGEVYALMNRGTDPEPCFDAVERVRDCSALWRRLYDGAQHAPHTALRQMYERLPAPDRPVPMDVVETACPRVVDLTGNGPATLFVSHRYGRVFRYDELPHGAHGG